MTTELALNQRKIYLEQSKAGANHSYLIWDDEGSECIYNEIKCVCGVNFSIP